jgi:hypothetical protein
VLALALALASCTLRPDRPARGCPDCPLPTADPRDLAAAACPDWQWVGVTAGACPAIPGWEAAEILAVGDRDGRRGDPPTPPDRDPGGGPSGATGRRQPSPPGRDPSAAGADAPRSRRPGEPREAATRRYCRYTDRGAGTVATLRTAGARGGLDALDRDCMAVVPLAAAAPDAETRRWREVERAFLARAGRATGLPTGGEPVRLVLIDTVANREVTGQPPWRAPWNSPHGVALASMAKRLSCRGNDEAAAGADCAAVEVEAELALAYVEYDRSSAAGSVRDDVRGGYVGTMSDLAVAIARAAERPGPARRVLNLSVGWNGYLFGGLEDDPAAMPAPVRAVLDALDLASARGAAIVAAAGNRNWGPVAEVDVGPMLPAGWAVRRRAGGAPLLEAAGGLAHEGFAAPAGYRSLPNARFRAVPRFLGFADHAVVERHRDAGETATLTGTSVSSLAVAASAAVSWLYLPAAGAPAVLDRVYDAGAPTRLAADFCPGGRLATPDGDARHRRGVVPAPSCPSGDPARRVRLCAAVAAACRAAGGGGCPACVPEDQPPPEVDHAALDRFAGAPAVSLAGRQPLTPADHVLCPPAATRRELAALAATDDRLRDAQSPPPGGERFFPARRPRSDLHRCPYWQFASLGAMAWVDPAPESSPCATCNFESGSPATVYLDLDPLFPRRGLAAPVLLVGDRAYALDWDPERRPRLIVEDVEYRDGETVFLAFALDDGLSAVSPLLRVR